MRVTSYLGFAAVLVALSPALAHRRPPLVSSGVRAAHPYRARGAVHVHTGASADGHGSLASVARAAREAGLDFVVVTDHNTGASVGIDGYRDGVLVLGGIEKSTSGGHALLLGLRALPFMLDGDPAAVARDAVDLGAFVVAAHPTSSQPEASWSGDLAGVAALEFLNLGEPDAWPQRGLSALWPLGRYLWDPQGTLLRTLRYSRAPLRVWDRALRERPLAGTLGSDAHDGFVAGPLWVPFPSYREVFRLASQHLLLRSPLAHDLEHDRALILEALREGRGYGALDGLADASGFLLEARCGGSRALMGESLALDAGAEIHAEADAPAGTTLVLMRDGAEVARGPRIVYATDRPGSYRVEAYLDAAAGPGAALPWILSNPVDLYPRDVLEVRAAAARRLPAPDPPGPTTVHALDDFAGTRLADTWVLDRARDATGRLSLEQRSLRLDYALGPGPSTHVAACVWQARDLARHASIVFRVRADRRMRFDVQVRTADASSPGGVRIWRRSVRAESDWRSVTLPLAALETYDRRGGRPSLADTRGIYFHVDEAMLAPGSHGTLWIGDLGLGR